MPDEPVDPWSAHVTRFQIRDAHVTGTPKDGALATHHGLTLIVEEGRYETFSVEEAKKDLPAALAYGCFIRPAGASDSESWSGTDMAIVVTGIHENGWRITIAGDGALGYDEDGSLEIHFEEAPRMAVYETSDAV
jgi:hypothetical protein